MLMFEFSDELEMGNIEELLWRQTDEHKEPVCSQEELKELDRLADRVKLDRLRLHWAGGREGAQYKDGANMA